MGPEERLARLETDIIYIRQAVERFEGILAKVPGSLLRIDMLETDLRSVKQQFIIVDGDIELTNKAVNSAAMELSSFKAWANARVWFIATIAAVASGVGGISVQLVLKLF